MVFLQLKVLLELFGITRFYTDRWGAYGSMSTQRSMKLSNSTRKVELPLRFIFPKLYLECLIALLAVLSVAYYSKGFLHLINGTDVGDAGDLHLRWTEE